MMRWSTHLLKKAEGRRQNLRLISYLVICLMQLQDLTVSDSSGPSTRDCILLAACEAHETLPQSAEFPADVFTSCLTTPIKMALRWWHALNNCLCFLLFPLSAPLSSLVQFFSGSSTVVILGWWKISIVSLFIFTLWCYIVPLFPSPSPFHFFSPLLEKKL